MDNSSVFLRAAVCLPADSDFHWDYFRDHSHLSWELERYSYGGKLIKATKNLYTHTHTYLKLATSHRRVVRFHFVHFCHTHLLTRTLNKHTVWETCTHTCKQKQTKAYTHTHTLMLRHWHSFSWKQNDRRYISTNTRRMKEDRVENATKRKMKMRQEVEQRISVARARAQMWVSEWVSKLKGRECIDLGSSGSWCSLQWMSLHALTAFIICVIVGQGERQREKETERQRERECWCLVITTQPLDIWTSAEIWPH